MGFDINILTSIAVAVIAIIAVIATIWQAIITRKHNRLSVRPWLMTEANEQMHAQSGALIISLGLVNNGTGPAVIKDFILLYKGAEVSRNNRTTFEAALQILDDSKILKELGTRARATDYFWAAPKGIIAEKEKNNIISVQIPTKPETKLQATKIEVQKILSAFDIVIRYQSIYEEAVFTYDSRVNRGYGGKS